jgi:hypothetical protein
MVHDRREVLQGFVAGAVGLSAFAQEAQAQQAGGVAPRGLTPYKNLIILLEKTHPWLRKFSPSYEVGIQEELEEIQKVEERTTHHNYRLVEPLLGEMAALLDRCLEYRREGAELEIQGVEHAYHELELRLAELDLAHVSAESLASSLGPVAEIFEQDGTPSARGQAARARAEGKASSNVAVTANQRRTLTLATIKTIQGITQQFKDRHLVPGNAHNFAERFQRLRELFNADITSAYRRAFAAEKGLRVVFGVSDKVPRRTPEKDVLLDDLVIWTRNVMRRVTTLVEREIEFEHIVPMTLYEGNGLGGNPNANFSQLMSQDGSGAYKFYVPPFRGMLHVRLRAVGASFIALKKDLTRPEVSGSRLHLNLMGPLHTAGGLRTGGMRRPLFVLPSVGPFLPTSPINYMQGSDVYNAEAEGWWHVKVKRQMMGRYAPNETRGDWIKGLYLHLRIAAYRNEEPEKWILGEY